MAKKGISLNSNATLSAYDPSLREKIAWGLSDMFGGGDRSKQNYINSKVGGAVDFVPVLGDAIGFDDAKRDFNEGNYGKAALGGAASLVGSVPGVGDAAAAALKAGGSSLGMFFGPRSALWDQKKWSDALNMEADNFNASKIWKETGMFRGKDNQWRAEFSDHQSSLNPDADVFGLSTDLTNQDILGDQFDHATAFAHYPEMRGIGLMDVPGGPEGGLGYFTQNNPLLNDMVDGGVPDYLIAARTNRHQTGDAKIDSLINPRKTILHEMQHYIQSKEGWDPGFNPQAAQDTLRRADSFTHQTGIKAINRIAEATGMDFNAARKKYEGWAGGKASFETYLRNAGETEARNVETRMDWDDVKRSLHFPNVTADRRKAEQLTQGDILHGRFDKWGTPDLVQGVGTNGAPDWVFEGPAIPLDRGASGQYRGRSLSSLPRNRKATR